MPKFSVKVHVRLKPSVLDPQGKAIEHAFAALGFKEGRNVRVGKVFEFEVEADSKEAASNRAGEMADTLLANTVIEDYSIRLDGHSS